MTYPHAVLVYDNPRVQSMVLVFIFAVNSFKHKCSISVHYSCFSLCTIGWLRSSITKEDQGYAKEWKGQKNILMKSLSTMSLLTVREETKFHKYNMSFIDWITILHNYLPPCRNHCDFVTLQTSTFKQTINKDPGPSYYTYFTHTLVWALTSYGDLKRTDKMVANMRIRREKCIDLWTHFKYNSIERNS